MLIEELSPHSADVLYLEGEDADLVRESTTFRNGYWLGRLPPDSLSCRFSRTTRMKRAELYVRIAHILVFRISYGRHYTQSTINKTRQTEQQSCTWVSKIISRDDRNQLITERRALF
jgi:hypothetical protein